MKKLIKGLSFVAIAASLMACAGGTKCTFEEFKENYQAKESVPWTKATVSYKYGDTSYENVEVVLNGVVLDKTALRAQTFIANCAANLAGYASLEKEGVTYYSGNGFKVVDGGLTTIWDKYGCVTSWVLKSDQGDGKATVKYSK